MGSQLQGSPRRLQPNAREHQKECINRVISENLVSPLRFTGQADLTLGFVTHSESDTLKVISEFVAHEKALPDSETLRNDVRSRLRQADGNLVYKFPENLLEGRYLLMDCLSVSVEQCANSQYTAKFGRGFSEPRLCEKIQHPALPIKKLNFEPEWISHCDGLLAFSEVAATRALHAYLGNFRCTINPASDSSLLFEHKQTSYSATIEVFEFISPASAQSSLRTPKGLLVIPHAGMQSYHQPIIISISITPHPHGETVTADTLQEGLTQVSALVQSGINELFGTSSPSKLLSVKDYLV